MRRWLAFAGVVGLGGCFAEAVPVDRAAEVRYAIWRLRQLVPEEAAREDILNLSHALEQFWLAVAEANPGQWEHAPKRSARPPEWACGRCGALRGGAFGEPSAQPSGACHRCEESPARARALYHDARQGILGRYPTRDEGLEMILPFLQDDPPAPSLRDPWGRPYVYVPWDDDGFGVSAVPRGRYLLYSVGPDGRDDGGDGDDVSNLPQGWVVPLPPPPSAAPLPEPEPLPPPPQPAPEPPASSSSPG